MAKENASDILDELTDKQRRFCEEYVIDWNGTRAAISAGYAKKSAHAEASRLLKNVKVAAYVDELKEKTAELAGVSALMIALEHKKIAFSSAADLRSDWGEVKEWEDLTDEEKAILAEVEVTEKVLKTMGEDENSPHILERKLKYKTYDKQRSLDALAKLLDLTPADKQQIEFVNPVKLVDDITGNKKGR